MLKTKYSSCLIVSISLLFATMLSGCGPIYDIKRSSLKSSASEADYGPKPTEKQLETEKFMIFGYLLGRRGKDIKFDSFQRELTSVERDIIQSSFASPTPTLVWVSMSQVSLKSPLGDFTETLPFSFAWSQGKVIATRYPFESAGAVFLNPNWKYAK